MEKDGLVLKSIIVFDYIVIFSVGMILNLLLGFLSSYCLIVAFIMLIIVIFNIFHYMKIIRELQRNCKT